MALINNIDCNKNFFGTGIGTCEILLNNQMDGLIRLPKGWSLPITNGNVPLTLDAAIELVQTTTFDPLLDAVDFADNTGDASTTDYTGGITSVNRNAKPTYQLIFESGLGFHQAAYSKNTFKSHNVLLVFGGTIAGAVSPDGLRFTGLNMGMFNVQTLRLPAGDTTMRTLVDFQLIDEDQFNRNLAVLTPDALGFNFSAEVMPITSTRLNVSASAGDPILVDVFSISNTGYGIEALEFTDFRVVDPTTNSVVPITSGSTGLNPWNWSLVPATPIVQGAQLYVELYDTTVGTATALVGDNQLYKGRSKTVTVAA